MSLRWRAAWLATWPLQKLMRLRVHGRRHLGPGPLILAANHVSNIDPVVVGMAAARELHFLAKEELFTASRAFAWLIRSFNAWPVRRGGADRAAIERCAWLLERRQTLVVFPEGTRSRTGEIAPFRPGVGLLAVTGRVPVVPVRLVGLDRSILSYWVDRDFVRRGLRRKPPYPVTIDVSFGEAVKPDGFPSDRAGFAEFSRVVEERVRALVPARPGN